MKKAGVCIAGIIGLVLSVNLVSAGFQALTTVLEPFANVSIADIYLRYASIVDFFLVFVIFGAIAKFAIGSKYGDTSKGVAVVVGLMMAIAFGFMESRYGFNIGSLGWISIIIFISFLLFFMFSMMTGMGANAKLSGAILFIVTYGAVSGLLPQVFEWMNTRAESSFGISLLLLAIHFVLITSVVKIIISVISAKNNFK